MTKALFYSRSKEDAEDSLQDAFVTIYQKLPDFKGENKKAFISWCSKITINSCLSKYKRHYFTFERNELKSGMDITIDPSIYSTMSKEEIVEQINLLPEGYREIFSLFAIDGFSHAEIADHLNIKESSSRSQYTRAKKKLKLQLERLSNSNIAI